MNRYKIVVHLDVKLTYYVNEIEVIEGTLIKFFDKKFGEHRLFDTRLVEIWDLQENEIKNGTVK